MLEVFDFFRGVYGQSWLHYIIVMTRYIARLVKNYPHYIPNTNNQLLTYYVDFDYFIYQKFQLPRQNAPHVLFTSRARKKLQKNCT